MSEKWNKILIHKERPFAARLGATFSFIKENWKYIGRYALLILLPVTLLFSFFFVLFIEQFFKVKVLDYLTPSAIGISIGFFFSALLLMLIIPPFYISFIQLYDEREEGLKGIKFRDFAKVLNRNFVRMAWLIICAVLILSLLSWLAIKTSLLLLIIVGILLFFFVVVPLFLLIPIYFIEGGNLLKAFKRSFKLGYKNWGGTLGIWLVLKIIGSMITTLFAFPWLILTYVESVFYSESSTLSISFSYQLMIFIFSLIMICGSILASLPLHIGMTYQYGHVSMHKKDILVVDNVEKAIESFKIVRDD
jgi:hypothetical protein